MPSQQATAAHWLSSAANSHALVQLSDTVHQQPNVSAYAYSQNSLLKFNKAFYLDARI